MANQPMIRRTGKLQALKALLKERRGVYLSAFFYSGKTVLLNQLCQAWEGDVLCFHSAQDDWRQFCLRVREHEQALIVIDSIDRPSEAMASELASLLAELSAAFAPRVRSPCWARIS